MAVTEHLLNSNIISCLGDMVCSYSCMSAPLFRDSLINPSLQLSPNQASFHTTPCINFPPLKIGRN